MHQTLRRATVAAATAALTVGLMGPAVAKPPEPPVDHAALLAQIGALEGAPGNSGQAHKKNLVRKAMRAGIITDEAAGTVTLPGGLKVQSDTIAGDGELVAAGVTVMEDTVPSTDGIVKEVPEGVQLLTVIKDAAAPDRFTYDFPGSVLTAQEDGSVLVDGEGEGEGDYTIDPAWAVDAANLPVNTYYEVVDGDTLVQVVEHIGATYPVVADPWISFGWFVYINYTKSDVRRIAPYAWTGRFSAVACVAIPNPYLAAACAIGVDRYFSGLSDTFLAAARYGQCVRTRHMYGSMLMVGYGRFWC